LQKYGLITNTSKIGELMLQYNFRYKQFYKTLKHIRYLIVITHKICPFDSFTTFAAIYRVGQKWQHFLYIL